MKKIVILFTLILSISAFTQEKNVIISYNNNVSLEIGGGNVYYLLHLEEGYNDLVSWNYETWNNYSIYFRSAFRVCCFTLGLQLKYATKNILEFVDSTPNAEHIGNCFIISGFERYDLISYNNFKLSPCIGLSVGYQLITIENVANNKLSNSDYTYYRKPFSSIQYDFSLESSMRLYNSLWLKAALFYNYTFNLDDHYYKPMHAQTSQSFGFNLGLEWYIW